MSSAVRGGLAVSSFAAVRRSHWRQTMWPEPADVREKALRHSRFDLWYGSHHLRFTRTLGADGTVVLRLDERARLMDVRGAEPVLVAAPDLPSPFVYEETVSRPLRVAGRDDRPGLIEEYLHSSVLGFFDRAAALLDRRAP
jgi:hypothetical protein